MSETYVELGGITPTGTMWGGLRYYDRENYIWTTDYFYTDYSGTGVGIKAMEMAGGKWDFAYINSNDTSHSDRANGTEATMHTLHTSALYGAWDMEIALKADAQQRVHRRQQAICDQGAEGTVIYSRDDFFFMPGGFSKFIAQAGRGLGSGTCWVPT